MSKEEDTILKIMREIYYHPDEYKEQHYIDTYKEEAWKLFSVFAFDTDFELVHRHVKDNTLKLTGRGAQEYYRMVAERQNQKRTEAMVYATLTMALATVVIALGTVIREPSFLGGVIIWGFLGVSIIVGIKAYSLTK